MTLPGEGATSRTGASAPLTGSIRLWVHNDALDRVGRDEEILWSRVIQGLRTGLASTGGSRLKRLRGPWHGRAFRGRWRHLRAPFSWVSDAAGVNHVVVHAVEPRDSVYENPEFHNRLDEFHDSLWSYPLQGFIHPLGGAGYVDVTQLVDDLKDEPGPEDAFAIGPLLGPEQRAALRCMVPFPEIFGRSDASVVLAHGPPGSGKTVLAIEAAKEAFETFGHSVIVLVPNERLRAAYQSALTEEGITFGDWKTFLTQQEQLICVAELPHRTLLRQSSWHP